MDGQISIAEAVTLTQTLLKRDRYNQNPTIAGQADDVAIFATSKSKPGTEKYRTLHAVVVGINKYRQAGADLWGAVNDANGFIKLLESNERRLFGDLKNVLITDEKATKSGINQAIAALRGKVTKDDLVVFYYSGHVTTVGKEKDVAKVIYPTDGDFEKGIFLRISEIVETVSKLGAKHALVVIDG